MGRRRGMPNRIGDYYMPVLYGIRRPSNGLLKVGRSIIIRQRFMQLRIACREPLNLEFTRFCPEELLPEAERWVHAILAVARIEGEWFAVDRDDAKLVVWRVIDEVRARAA